MRIITLLALAACIMLALPASAQKSKKKTAKANKTCTTTGSCCGTADATANAEMAIPMAQFASSDKFQTAHIVPLPFMLENPIGTMVKLKSEGAEVNAYEIKAKGKSDKVLFVFQEWWGLNDYVKQEAERYYKALGEQVTVIAPDMYDGKIATTPQDAGAAMQALNSNPTRVTQIMGALLAHAGSKAKIGTIGWCMGGGLSHRATLAAGKQGVACIIYYGQPEMDAEKLKASNAPVLNIWPKQDKWINQAMMDKFAASMKEAGKSLRIEPYDADHAFANPSNPKHDKTMTEDANGKSVAFLKQHLVGAR